MGPDLGKRAHGQPKKVHFKDDVPSRSPDLFGKEATPDELTGLEVKGQRRHYRRIWDHPKVRPPYQPRVRPPYKPMEIAHGANTSTAYDIFARTMGTAARSHIPPDGDTWGEPEASFRHGPMGPGVRRGRGVSRRRKRRIYWRNPISLWVMLGTKDRWFGNG